MNSLRNKFAHFPASYTWNLETSGLQRITLAAIDAAEFIAFESQNVPWFHLEDARVLRARQPFGEIRSELRALETP